jgi:hypothetical protein
MNSNWWHKPVRDYFPLPKRIRKLAAMADGNLWYSLPIIDPDETEETHIPFHSAVGEIADWVSVNVHEVWVDRYCDDVSDQEPEGDEIYPPSDEWWHIELSDVKRAIFGEELSHYV